MSPAEIVRLIENSLIANVILSVVSSGRHPGARGVITLDLIPFVYHTAGLSP